jgi:hypothetical protein
MGVGWACVSTLALSITLTQWFERQYGLALSLALTGASAGGFAVAPALVGLSQSQGFAAAVPEVVLSLIALTVPVIWLGIRPQADQRPPWPLVAAHGRGRAACGSQAERGVAGCTVLVRRGAIRARALGAGQLDRLSGELSLALTRLQPAPRSH